MAAADEIAEKLAQKISLTQNPTTGDRTFVRWWKPQSMVLSSEVEAALLAITSVTDPQYENGTKVEAGTWQVTSAGWEPKLGGYVQVLTIASPLDGGVVTTSDDIYETATEQQLFNQSAAPSIGTFTVGVLKRISAAIDRTLKKWTVQWNVVTSKTVVSHFQIQLRHGGGIEHHVICRNQKTEAPVFTVTASDGFELPALAAGTMYDFVGHPSKNPDGTWNWYIVYKEDDLPISVGETKNLIRVRLTQRTKRRYTDGYSGQLWWQKEYYYTIIHYQCFATKDEAWQMASQTNYDPAIPQRVAPGVWLAKWEIQGELPMTVWDTPVEE